MHDSIFYEAVRVFGLPRMVSGGKKSGGGNPVAEVDWLETGPQRRLDSISRDIKGRKDGAWVL